MRALRAVAGLVIALAASVQAIEGEPRVVVHVLADEVARARGLTEAARRTVGAESLYVLGDGTESRVETPSLRIPSGAELRLRLGVLGSGRFGVRARGGPGRSLPLLSRTAAVSEADWVETRIPLEDARVSLGPKFSLVFKARGDGRALWGDPVIVAPPQPGTKPPAVNVLLISIDTLRADRLGCYGGPPTPTLDRIAGEGALFEVAEGAAPSTRPSHATMLTGVYPCVHHVGTEPGGALPPGLPTIAQILRGHGYTTAAITEGGYLDAAFERGFGAFRVDSAGTLERPTGRVEDVVADARAWLARHADERFFLFLHTYQPHFPYTPPTVYRNAPTDPSRRIARNPTVPATSYESYDPDLYDAEVRYTDAALAPLFAALDQLGLSRQTLVIVTSDHGEAFGEHRQFLHGGQLYEEDLRIPLIWWLPGIVRPTRLGPIVAGPADILPTVLQVAGVAPAPWVHGRNLARAWQSDPPGVWGENMVYSELPPADGRTHSVAVRGGHWKSVFSFPYVPGSPMTLVKFDTDREERSPMDISRDTGVSWTPYLTQECARAAKLLAARGDRGS